MTEGRRNDWLQCLDEDDLAFLRRFVIGSGSLKAVAKAYGVSYPTVRLRLDRLIQKIEIYEDQAVNSPFERLLRTQVASGAVDTATARRLLGAHQAELTASTIGAAAPFREDPRHAEPASDLRSHADPAAIGPSAARPPSIDPPGMAGSKDDVGSDRAARAAGG